MQGAAPGQGQLPKEGPSLFPLACKAICLAMGVAVAVLSVLGQLDTRSGFCLLGIGLACGGMALLRRQP